MQFSLVMYEGLSQSFCQLKPDPFLMINFKLEFRSAFIQCTTDGHKQDPPYIFIFENPFHSDVHDNVEKKICCYFRYIATFSEQGKRTR